MELNLKISGTLLIILSILHAIFPRYFKWKTELSQLSLINRQMMLVHTFFIAFVLLLMGLLCVTSAAELIGTPLGKKLCMGFTLFWQCRLIIQFYGYSPRLWRGKKFETIIHIVFTLCWVYFSALFMLIYIK